MNPSSMPERQQMVPVVGLELAVTQWGPRDGMPIIMLHGLRSYAQTFCGIAAALQPRWRVIAIDHRGRGQSDWDPLCRYDTLTYVSDLEAVVAALGIESFHLLGHSMGGANAIVYAARHPQRVRGLVIEDMGPGASASSAGSERIRRELAGTPQQFANWSAARAFWRAIRPGVTEEAITSRVHHSLKQTADGSVIWRHDQQGIAEARARVAPLDLWPYALALPGPTLLVRGAESDFLSEATAVLMAQRCRNLMHVAVAGAGHYVHDDAPEIFHTAVRAFLEQQA